MKSKKISYFLVCMVWVILALGITACSSNKESSDSTKNSSQYNSTDTKKISSNSTSNKKGKVENPKDSAEKHVPAAKDSGGLSFLKKELTSDTQVSFSTPWKSSEDGTYSACIEGKGSEALEEGQGRIIVKSGQKVYSFEIENNTEISPKYLEWVDNENILVVIGGSQGTVAKGGDLYMLNVNKDEAALLIKTPSKKQQIMSAQKNENDINLKVDVYDDDMYNKSHVEDWIIHSFNTNLNGKIEVKNSDGKVVYEINE
ncbi:DUF4652 domain-containing protein [Clostridium sp. JNZ X4-2]